MSSFIQENHLSPLQIVQYVLSMTVFVQTLATAHMIKFALHVYMSSKTIASPQPELDELGGLKSYFLSLIGDIK